MARKVSAETRQDLLQAIRERYRAGMKEEKLRILDEFVAVTGYHRKEGIDWTIVSPQADNVRSAWCCRTPCRVAFKHVVEPGSTGRH